MNNQIVGLVMVIGSLVWMAFGDLLRRPLAAKPLETAHPDSTPEKNNQAIRPIESRVDAVGHCELLMVYFESSDNKVGSDCIRTAISSIYAPKE